MLKLNFFADVPRALQTIAGELFSIRTEIERNTEALKATNLDSPRLTEKLNARNIPRHDDAGRTLDVFERVCLAFDMFDRVRAGKVEKWDKGETGATK